ncbi:MAG: BrnT family toxin [Alphaproteobacteria bacterium]|jgi:uncharacterized DUF497 family protein|nr:BrnT family toxin [Alphaproteobacteria bacterium]
MITWDEPKRLANLARHGIDLAHAERFGWEDALIAPTHQGNSDRPRFKAIGLLGDRVIVVVFSPLGTEAISVISMRPANRKEREGYDQS